MLSIRDETDNVVDSISGWDITGVRCAPPRLLVLALATAASAQTSH